MDLSDRELLARTLAAEAGAEGPDGMLAAGAVIMNRAASGNYGNGLRGVILKPGQFSAWNAVTGYAGGKGANDIVNRPPPAQAYQVADTLLSGTFQDPTGGATHYYAPKYADPAWGMRAGGDWLRIGGHVFGKADAGRGSYTPPARTPAATGGQPMADQGRMPVMSTQGMPAQAPEPERKGLFNPDVRDRLIIALEGMTLNPNTALMGQASQGISDRRKEKADEKARNRTLEWLKSSGLPNADLLIGAVASGSITPGEAARAGLTALQAQQQAANDPNVQSSQMLPDQSGTVFNMRDGTLKVVTVGGETLTGDAAVQFVQEAQQRGADLERSKYGARREGTLGANIELGGAAAAAEEEGKQRAQMAVEMITKVSGLGSNIANINDAIAAIDGGAQTGALVKYLPNVTTASVELDNAMKRMGLDVIQATTFGALSKDEMNFALSINGPQNMEPKALREWFVKKRDAQIKAREALLAAAAYLADPENSLKGFIEKQQGDAPAARVLTYDPATGEFK